MFEALVKTGTESQTLQVLWKRDSFKFKALVVVITKSQMEQITWQRHKGVG